MSFVLHTRTAPLRIVHTDGRVTECELFLHEAGDGGSGRQDVSDRLNDPAAGFVPVRLRGGDRDGSVELVNLDRVAYAASRSRVEIDELESLGARRERVDLEVAGGTQVGGELLHLGRPGFERVSDALNDGGDRFLLLWTGEETVYVRRAAIARARPS